MGGSLACHPNPVKPAVRVILSRGSGTVPGLPFLMKGTPSVAIAQPVKMNDTENIESITQEIRQLRSVFEAIHEALQAAVVRLATIQAKVGVPSSSGVTPANEAPAPRAAAGRGASRSRGEWTLPDGDWTAPDGAVTGESLRSRREALGISQAAVAHAAHCSRGLVAEVERGRRRSAMTLSHLSQVLDKLEQQARRN